MLVGAIRLGLAVLAVVVAADLTFVRLESNVGAWLVLVLVSTGRCRAHEESLELRLGHLAQCTLLPPGLQCRNHLGASHHLVASHGHPF